MARLTVHRCYVCGKGILKAALASAIVNGVKRPFHRVPCLREWSKPKPEKSSFTISAANERRGEWTPELVTETGLRLMDERVIPDDPKPESTRVKSQDIRGKKTRQPPPADPVKRTSFPRKNFKGELV